jgi:hypothetical protein
MDIIIKKIYKTWILSLTSLVFLSACDNPNAPDCFQKAGEEKTIELHNFDSFNELVINDDIDLQIVEDDTTYFELSFYENLIPEIVSYAINDSLIFENKNSCNFVRDFKKPLLIYHSNKALNRIITMSTGLISASDTLRNNLYITSEDISGKVILMVNNEASIFSSNSTCNFVVSGRTKRLVINAYFNDGKFDCKDLTCERAVILQRGYNDIIISPTDSLVGSIENAGRVYYSGSPGIKMNIFGGGELIQIR